MTMTASRMLGFGREDAARFSMLMSIPAIIAAGTMATCELIAAGDATLQGDAVIAAFFAFLSALIAIALMMRWLRRATFTPFVAYRMVLGVILLGVVYL